MFVGLCTCFHQMKPLWLVRYQTIAEKLWASLQWQLFGSIPGLRGSKPLGSGAPDSNRDEFTFVVWVLGWTILEMAIGWPFPKSLSFPYPSISYKQDRLQVENYMAKLNFLSLHWKSFPVTGNDYHRRWLIQTTHAEFGVVLSGIMTGDIWGFTFNHIFLPHPFVPFSSLLFQCPPFHVNPTWQLMLLSQPAPNLPMKSVLFFFYFPFPGRFHYLLWTFLLPGLAGSVDFNMIIF